MITFTREEAQQVLDALEDVIDDAEEPHKTKNAFEFLRTKLSAPEPEPVAHITKHDLDALRSNGRRSVILYTKEITNGIEVPLYTAPPQREWVGEGQALSETLKRMADNAIMVAGNGHIDCDSNARRVLFAEIDNLCAVFDTPPQRDETSAKAAEWIGLTDEELLDLADMAYANDLELLQTLQAKLKEKNYDKR